MDMRQVTVKYTTKLQKGNFGYQLISLSGTRQWVLYCFMTFSTSLPLERPSMYAFAYSQAFLKYFLMRVGSTVYPRIAQRLQMCNYSGALAYFFAWAQLIWSGLTHDNVLWERTTGLLLLQPFFPSLFLPTIVWVVRKSRNHLCLKHSMCVYTSLLRHLLDALWMSIWKHHCLSGTFIGCVMHLQLLATGCAVMREATSASSA